MHTLLLALYRRFGVRTCPRCGDRYPASRPECWRCRGLDNAALAALRRHIATEERPLQDMKFVVYTAAIIMTIATIFAFLASH